MEFYPESASIIQQAALKIACRGKPVFPCNPDKEPYTPNGFYSATTNPDKVRAYWRKHPDAFIGMRTGATSGVFVLDIDRLSAISELPFPLPRTLTAKTRSGGLHLFFNYVEGIRNSAGALPPDMDVRGEGGYVIASPSPGYVWVDRSPVAVAPEWLLDLILEKPEQERKQRNGHRPVRDAEDLLDADIIHNGARNNTLTSVCGRLHDGSRDLPDLERALLEVNERRCSEPLPEAEVIAIARSIYRKDPCTPGRRSEDIPEIQQRLALFEQATICYDWGRWPGGLSTTKALLRKAREFGRLRPDGNIELNLSYNELALEAATSERSIKRYAKKIKPTGFVSQDNADRRHLDATTWVLNVPARGVTTRLTRKGRKTLGGGGDTSRTLPLTRPRLRASERFIQRLGKSWERVRDVLEAAGGCLDFETLAEAAGIRRTRELRNPRPGGWLDRAVEARLVRVTSGGLQLLDGWEKAEDDYRQRTGEIAAATRDREAYKRRRKDWLDRINHGEIVKRPQSEAERYAREELRVLREAGAERVRYRRKMKAYRAEMARKKRRENMPRRTLWATRAMTNPDTSPGVLTESYFRGEVEEFDYIVGAVAQFYKDGKNWRAWRDDVREAWSEIAPYGLVVSEDSAREAV